MRMAFDRAAIEIQRESSHAELLELLTRCSLGHVVLGEYGRNAEGFWAARVLIGWEQIDSFGIGVCTAFQAPPYVLPVDSTGVLVFGFDQEIVGVSLVDRAVKWRYELDSAFRCFLLMSEAPLVVVAYETGIMAFNYPILDFLWKFSGAIITNLKIVDDVLALSFLDDASINVALKDGRVL